MNFMIMLKIQIFLQLIEMISVVVNVTVHIESLALLVSVQSCSSAHGDIIVILTSVI